MSIARIPRFLLPREASYQFSRSLRLSAPYRPSSLPNILRTRHASNSSKPASSVKPRVLEKPSKFNPPSHPARINRAPPRQYPGPPLSASEREAQKTRRYPHMMPADGTFMHWFLTKRSIHVFITLGILFTLAIVTLVSSFTHNSPFSHLLPPARDFWSHPFSFFGQYIEVYRLHTARITAETAERRMKKMDDVRKRGEYRKAHGYEEKQGWIVRGKGEGMSVGAVGDGRVVGEEGGTSLLGRIEEGGVKGEGRQGGDEDIYTDFEGRTRRRKHVKKWLGIW